MAERIFAGLGLATYISDLSNTSLSDWWMFNPEKNEWIQKRDFPGQRTQSWSFSLDDSIYVGGGVKQVGIETPPIIQGGLTPPVGVDVAYGFSNAGYTIGRTSLADVVAGDQRLSPDPPPSPSGPASWDWFNDGIFISNIDEYDGTYLQFTTDDSKYYVVIGINGLGTIAGVDVTATLYNMKRFTSLADASLYMDYLQSPGGYTTPAVSTPSYVYKDIFKYELNYNKWNQIYNIPDLTSYEFAYSKAFAISSYGYLGLGNTQKFFKYYPPDNLWTSVASFPGTPRIFPNYFVVGTYGYVGGGYNTNNIFLDYYRYDIVNNVWTGMPTFIGSQTTNQFSFGLDTMGIVGGGLISTYTPKSYAYIPSRTGWTTIPTFIGTYMNWSSGVALNATTGHVLFGENTTLRTGVNYQIDSINIPTWQPKATLPAQPRSRAIAEKANLNIYNNYIYFTTGSLTQYPVNCNLFALKVNNFDEYYGPSWVATVPIVASSYWQAPSMSGYDYNSYYPMDVAANSEYVLVTQWHYAASLGDASYGTNLVHVGARLNSDNATVGSWNSQIVHDTVNVNPKIDFGAKFITNPVSHCFYVQQINNKITKEATIVSTTIGRFISIPNPEIIRQPDQYQYSIPTWGVADAEHNRSPFIRFANSGLLLKGQAFPYGLSDLYPAEVTKYDDLEGAVPNWLKNFTWVKQIIDGE